MKDMDIKKEYEVDDSVWIHGIHKDNRLTKGQVIKKFTMEHKDWNNDFYYVVAIPTHIEPLLEIRQWECMSQDSQGPIGMYRDMGQSKVEVDKFLSKAGYTSSYDEDLDEPTPEQIHAAIEKAQNNAKHTPLLIKQEKPKRKYYHRKKKQ